MSTFRSILSSVKYHALTRPAITTAKHAVKAGMGKLAKYVHDKKVAKSGRKVGLRDKIMSKTRGTTANNPRVWNKTTLAGLQRRKAAANKAKAIPRPTRKYGTRASSKPVGASQAKKAVRPNVPHGSVQAAVNSSRTHGQLRRKVTGLAVRKVSAGIKGTRQARAVSLRNMRKERPSALKAKVKSTKLKLASEAAATISKRKKT